ncbi:MAG TPA: tRNA (adenosine(37)-N6)-threonylcarbamoyltransferase complex ATPase subunit type 1 TsaE, partial [Acinetobacter pseudolwoffii]|nr:tRNA (adenosine(37)-N6)-threonylcarbamoyltransferase complex ATPase subunit type 1 TsaE [Acinetobacter pseudolwoffii]
FEWPSKGGDEIPQADLIIEILKSQDELTRTASLISSNLALREALERQFSHVE